jgi:(p)ppGpp synthase/HD superfamily hydrolase
MAERSPPLSPRIIEARAWATELHDGQTRKGPLQLPYIGHPLAVAELVRLDGGTEDQQIGALLHDAIEDCGITAEQIAERFGLEVAAIVEACSDCGPTARGGAKPPWRQRKVASIEALGEKPREALLVIAADKLHNTAATLEDARAGRLDWSIFRAGLPGACWYTQAMHEGLAELLPTSRSVQLLGEALADLLALPDVVAAAAGEDPADWARRFPASLPPAGATSDGSGEVSVVPAGATSGA